MITEIRKGRDDFGSKAEVWKRHKVKENKADYGFNARTEEYENMFKAGIIDPTKVTRVALENAPSIAGMLLTTECVVADKPEPKSAAPAMPGGGGMGMDY